MSYYAIRPDLVAELALVGGPWKAAVSGLADLLQGAAVAKEVLLSEGPRAPSGSKRYRTPNSRL